MLEGPNVNPPAPANRPPVPPAPPGWSSRACHETVDEMGVEAVLALKRERDELRAEVSEVTRRVHATYQHRIEALEAQVRSLLDPVIAIRVMERPPAIQVSAEGIDRLDQNRRALLELEDGIVSLLPGPYYMDPPDGGSVTLLEQLQRMAEDARKWRESQQ